MCKDLGIINTMRIHVHFLPGGDLLRVTHSRECCHVHFLPSGELLGASRGLQLFHMRHVRFREDLNGRQPRMLLRATGACSAHWVWSGVRRGQLRVAV